jgi:tetratricopeptide (TPR) repeat protein
VHQLGKVNQDVEMLNHAISSGYYGNEYAYGLLGDAYLKKGETKKAIEFYRKSGSIDSLKKLKRMGVHDPIIEALILPVAVGHYSHREDRGYRSEI